MSLNKTCYLLKKVGYNVLSTEDSKVLLSLAMISKIYLLKIAKLGDLKTCYLLKIVDNIMLSTEDNNAMSLDKMYYLLKIVKF